jgi:sec-independent protein translocase protein TatB
MILLSPPKVLMILVIALIVLGPDKLPAAARRVGALWSEISRWRAHVEREVRATFPDLPSTTEIARAVRSPISMLDRLADEHGATSGAAPGGASGVPGIEMASMSGPGGDGPRAPDPEPSVPARARPAAPEDAPAVPDVSSMN